MALRDGTVHASVANAGDLDHPVNGASVVGIVAAAGSHKLTHLRIPPRVTVVLRSGRRWAVVEGAVELACPDQDQGRRPGAEAEKAHRTAGTHQDLGIRTERRTRASRERAHCARSRP